jgi:DNA-binding NarL/FixJ family response regulator
MIPRTSDIKVATVEDDDEFRGYLAALIGGADGFHCIGSYRSAEIALTHLPVEQPEVLLLDLELPGKQGLQLISEIIARWPKIVVLILTIHDDSARIFPALEAGAVGYLVKPVAPTRLLEAIAEAHAGGSPMSSQIARLVVRAFQRRCKIKSELENLSPREEEILSHVAKGFQSRDIAESMGISPRTVGTHLRNIYEKLHVHSRAHAVAKYLRQ